MQSAPTDIPSRASLPVRLSAPSQGAKVMLWGQCSLTSQLTVVPLTCPQSLIQLLPSNVRYF